MLDPTSRQLLAELQRFRAAWRAACERDPELSKSLNRLRSAAEAFFGAELDVDEPSAPAPAKSGVRSDERRARSRSLEDFRARLAPVPARCELKAEAARLALAAKRKGRTRPKGGELDPAEGALFARAKELPDCSLWMLERDPAAFEEHDLEILAACYENVGTAARHALAGEAESGPEAPPSRKLMTLMAEAQSALYAMLSRMNVRTDRDQLESFTWLRERTDYHRIYIPRYMDRNRLAKPEDAEELAHRLEAVSGSGQKQHRSESGKAPDGGGSMRGHELSIASRSKRRSQAS